MRLLERRSFIKETAAVTAFTILHRRITFSINTGENQIDEWRKMMTDPVYDMLREEPDLDQILSLFLRQLGEPAFDPDLIRHNINKIKTVPEINTGHPFLDLSIKTALAHINATFQGDHPKYGVGTYGHISYHQCRDHLTAFEQFNFPGDPRGSKAADYCLPAQLVAARAGRLLNKS